MRKKYILAIIILLFLLAVIYIYKEDFFKNDSKKQSNVDSNNLINERIEEGKKFNNDNEETIITTTVEETTTESLTTLQKSSYKKSTGSNNTSVNNQKNENDNKDVKNDEVNNDGNNNSNNNSNDNGNNNDNENNDNGEVTEPVKEKTNAEKLEDLINKDFDVAVKNNEVSKYEYPFQIDYTLKSTIESINNSKLDYSKNRFYIVNSNLLLNDSGMYIYDKYTKHVIKVDHASNRSMGTWFWCSNKNHEVLTDISKQNSFFDKLSDYNITEIYMSFHHKQLNDENIKRFIRNAYKRNIRVYLCLGELDFLKPDSYKSSIYEVFDYVNNYNISVNYDERFAGVSYDAEVWNNREYNWKNDINIRNQHVEYIKEAKRYADNKNLSVIFTLSFWLVQYNTSNGNMYDEITKVLDRTTLMVYRDDYEKLKHLIVDKQENASDSLINIASKNNCLIDIAVETMYSDEGNQVSFYEEEKANPGYLLSTLNRVDSLLNNYDNRMFSIHHAMSLINDFKGGL